MASKKLHLWPHLLLGAVGLAACATPESTTSSSDALLSNASTITNNNDGTWTVACKDGRVERHTTDAEMTSFAFCPKVVRAMRYFKDALFDFATIDEGNVALSERLRAEGYRSVGSQFYFFTDANAYGRSMAPVYLCASTPRRAAAAGT